MAGRLAFIRPLWPFYSHCWCSAARCRYDVTREVWNISCRPVRVSERDKHVHSKCLWSDGTAAWRWFMRASRWGEPASREIVISPSLMVRSSSPIKSAPRYLTDVQARGNAVWQIFFRITHAHTACSFVLPLTTAAQIIFPVVVVVVALCCSDCH